MPIPEGSNKLSPGSPEGNEGYPLSGPETSPQAHTIGKMVFPVLSYALAVGLRQAAHPRRVRVELGQGISVRFPAKPEFKRYPERQNLELWVVDLPTEAFFAQSIPVEFPKHSALWSLQQNVTEGAISADKSIVSAKPLLLNGWKGLEVRYSGPGATWDRSYRVGKTVLAVSYLSDTGTMSEAGKRFLDSLTVPKSLHGPFRSAAEPESVDARTRARLALGGGVQVVFPEKFELVREASTGSTRLWGCPTGGGSFLAKVETPKPTGLSATEILKRAANDAAKVAGGVILSSTPFIWHGWKALEVRGKVSNFTSYGRIYLIDGKVYGLYVSTLLPELPIGGKEFFASLSGPAQRHPH